MNLPLIGQDQSVAGVRRLTLTAAVRTEDYDSFGGVTTPKLGLSYDPNADFTFKVSWGKSFKAPTLHQQNWTQTAYLYPARTLGGAGFSAQDTALYLNGGRSDLDPETARTWSGSLVYRPAAAPGLEIELTGFDIDYTDRVVQAIAGNGFIQSLSDPIYAEFVTYDPTPGQQAATLAGMNFSNVASVPYDPSRVVAIVDARFINVARQTIRGVDLSGAYRFDLAQGHMTLRGSASWLDSSQQTSSAQSTFDLAGTLFNPAQVNGRLGAVWNEGGFTASAFANYTSGVTNTVRGETTASFTTFDTSLRYVTGERGALSGLAFAISMQNVFNRAPPFATPAQIIYSLPYDPTNHSAVGRFLSVSVSKHF